MKLENFKRIFELQEINDKFLDNLQNILKMTGEELPPVECFWETMDIIWKNEYTIEGIDWINWFMFEKSEGLNAYNNGEIFLESIEELWEYVEENCKINK